MRRLLSIVFIVLMGCGKTLPEFENLSLNNWKNDKNACGQYRTQTQEIFQSQKEKLLALKESQIIELLGRPDRNELYKRNQKFYHYYLTASSDCASPAQDSKRLVIRFNAMGLAKEIAVE